MVKTLRVLHLPADVAGQAIGVSLAERRTGIKSDTALFRSSNIGVAADYNLRLERFRLPFTYLARLFFFFRFFWRYNVFHFYFAESFLPWNLDLPLLVLLQKRIFFTFQGCDIRCRSMSFEHGGVQQTLIHHCICNRVSDDRKRTRLRFIHRYATKTYVLNPDLQLASPTSEFLPYAHFDVKQWRAAPSRIHNWNQPLRIIHAPTDRALKGTHHIVSAVERLQQRGVGIELLLAERVTQQHVKDLAASADLAIDQLVIGWYGGFAVEMMALGVPTLCYLDRRLFDRVPYARKIPIINVTPESLEQTLADLAQHRERLQPLAHASRRFVEMVHDPDVIASRLIDDYAHACRKI